MRTAGRTKRRKYHVLERPTRAHSQHEIYSLRDGFLSRACTHKSRFVSELDPCPLSGVLQTQTGHRLRSEKCQKRPTLIRIKTSKCSRLRHAVAWAVSGSAIGRRRSSSQFPTCRGRSGYPRAIACRRRAEPAQCPTSFPPQPVVGLRDRRST